MARWSSAHASRFYHLLTKVAEFGHEIFVIQPPSRASIEANDFDVALKVHHNINVITLPINEKIWMKRFPFDKLFKKFLYTLCSLVFVKKICKKENIDFLYIYNIPQFLLLFGKKPKVLFDMADDLLGMLKAELSISSKNLMYILASKCLNWILYRSDVVICISEHLYEKINHPRKYIIPNGADFPHEVLRLPNNNDNSSITVGYVGAFEYYMALDQIVEVADRLRDIKFILVGIGRDFPRIENIIRKRNLTNVTLTGALPHRDAMKIISSVDICLNLFNKTDVSHAVSPLKLFEYISCKKPVISTRLREVERIDRGFLFYADTVDEIVERIQYICAHREEALDKAERGYSYFSKEYSWENIAKNFIRILSEN